MKKNGIININKTNRLNLFKGLKISILFLLISFNYFPVNTGYSQSGNENRPIKTKMLNEVINEIQANSGYYFLYLDSTLNLNKKVNIDIRNKSITQILNELFTDEYQYKISGRQILISKNKATENKQAPAKRKKVTGYVSDETGNPLPGVTIIVLKSTRGVITDNNGYFELANLADTDKLKFSFIGYGEEIIDVGNQTNISLQMKPKVDELDEVTVIAYGKQKKESVIGAISSISPSNIKIPVGKISTSLAGQVAGIVSLQRSGEPGAGSDFWIRGISTFGANNKPLVLVDGIERSIDLVDSEDIETFSILKDATATAVYGVRGANGIVLITTKRGREGKMLINAKVDYGISSPILKPKMADAESWIDYYNDITFDATGHYAYSKEQRDHYVNKKDLDLYPNVNWMDELFKNSSTNQRINLNISGGSKRIRYYVSGAFYSENSIYNSMVGSDYNPELNYKRYNFRSNVDIDITGSTVVNVSLSNLYEKRNKPGTDLNLWRYAMMTPPIATPTIYSDGTLASPHNGRNPWNILNKTGYAQDTWNNAQSLVGITQDFSDIITKGLEANVKFSWDARNVSTINRYKNPANYYATGRNENGELIFHKNQDGSDYLSLKHSNSGSTSINLESSIVYNNVFNDNHRTGALFLFSMRQHSTNFPNTFIDAFPYRNIGIAGRVTYSFKDVYFIEGNFGYNGSENFAPKKRFGFFPSLAIGYLVSNESFFSNLKETVSLLKLKGSYGEIGNDQIGGDRRFAFNSEMSKGNDYIFGSSGQTYIAGITTGHPGNPNVSWETAKKLNIGIELGFLNNLKFQVDYFHEKRDGIYIQQRSIPSIVGLNKTRYVNLGKMKNEGVDASMEFDHHFSNGLFFSARANYTFNRNKRLYDDHPTPVWGYQELAGYPNNQQFGMIALGLFKDQMDIDNSPKQMFGAVKPGDIKYKDVNGDGFIDKNDEVAIGYTDIPEINYGFGVSLAWKGIDLSLFFQGVDNVTHIIGGSPIMGRFENLLVFGGIYDDVAGNRWTKENQNAKYPRMHLAMSNNNARPSTLYQRDMSFLRLKNAEIGYTLPKKIMKKLAFSTVRFYVQGLNLLTFSKFKLWDPEQASRTSVDSAVDGSIDNLDFGALYPQMRVISCGLNLNF